jgi:hypothetical protein
LLLRVRLAHPFSPAFAHPFGSTHTPSIHVSFVASFDASIACPKGESYSHPHGAAFAHPFGSTHAPSIHVSFVASFDASSACSDNEPNAHFDGAPLFVHSYSIFFNAS